MTMFTSMVAYENLNWEILFSSKLTIALSWWRKPYMWKAGTWEHWSLVDCCFSLTLVTSWSLRYLSEKHVSEHHRQQWGDTEVTSEYWCQSLSHVSEILCASYPGGWCIPGWDVCPVHAVQDGHNPGHWRCIFLGTALCHFPWVLEHLYLPTFHTCTARSLTTRCPTPWYLISFCCPTKTNTTFFCVCDQPGSPNQPSRAKFFITS